VLLGVKGPPRVRNGGVELWTGVEVPGSMVGDTTDVVRWAVNSMTTGHEPLCRKKILIRQFK
jgi:hypothetical protein